MKKSEVGQVFIRLAPPPNVLGRSLGGGKNVNWNQDKGIAQLFLSHTVHTLSRDSVPLKICTGVTLIIFVSTSFLLLGFNGPYVTVMWNYSCPTPLLCRNC